MFTFIKGLTSVGKLSSRYDTFEWEKLDSVNNRNKEVLRLQMYTI